MQSTLEVLFAPAEYDALARRDLGETACVVFDILRATTTMTTALANGAEAMIPVAEIAEAVQARRENPAVLLAGERKGWRITAEQSGGYEFDFGNSPREFTREKVEGKTIAITTTNGTRALRACAPARHVLLGAFLNLAAVADWIRTARPRNLLLVCSGTADQGSFEDALGAGAVADLVWPLYADGKIADSAYMAKQLYADARADLIGAMQNARNGRRLLALPELRDDVPLCFRRDTVSFVAGMSGGRVRRLDA